VAVILVATGAVGFNYAKAAYAEVWGQVNMEIEDLIRRADA
jgi:hypothetical protein